MGAKKNFLFLVSVSAASAALAGSVSAKDASTPNQTSITQRITVPGNAIIAPADKASLTSVNDDSDSNHDSHSSHDSHDSHDSHYSSSPDLR